MDDRQIKALALDFRGQKISRRQLAKQVAALGVSASGVSGVLGTVGAVRSASAQASTALQIGRESEFTPAFLPLKTATGGQTQVFDLVYSRLLKFSDDLSLVPDAAESYEVSPDATVFTFKLREGMTWHDGAPFTARDVIFTYKLAMTKAAGARQWGKL